jgi:hypothetical protein
LDWQRLIAWLQADRTVSDGMQPLRLAGALRVAEGRTILEEVLSATPDMGSTRV